MIPQIDAGFKGRTPLKSYRPDNARVIACITYHDPHVGIVARSERGLAGILRTPPAIAWDAGVIAQLERDGVQHVETYIKDTQATYTTTIESMRQHGRYANRCGLQLILSLKYWSFDGQALEQDSPLQPEQLSLFGGE